MSLSASSLNGLAVLITRPKAKAKILAKLIEENGGTPLLLPTVEIVPCELNYSLTQLQEHFSKADKIIFISSNAVLHLPQVIKKILVAMYNREPQIFSMGQSTTEELINNNIKAWFTMSPGDTSETLLSQEFFQKQNIVGKKVLIVGGVGGRKLLEESLGARGADVTKIGVYQRMCPTIDLSSKLKAWKAFPNFTVLVTSQNILENLIKIFNQNLEWLQQKPLIVPSRRIANFAKTQGFLKIVKAAGANDKNLLKSLWKIV